MIVDRWIENVVKVKSVSERLLVLKLAMGKNVVSSYVPEISSIEDEKVEFLATLWQVLRMFNDSKGLIVYTVT